MQKRFIRSIMLVVLIVLGVVIAVLYGRQNNTSTISPEPAATSYQQQTNWKTFSDADFGVSFQYPSTWTLGGVRKIHLTAKMVMPFLMREIAMRSTSIPMTIQII